MNGKLNIDTVLREWPSPNSEDHAWEQRAEAIVKAAVTRSSSATHEEKAKAEALTAPPALPPEPGEPGGRTSLPGEIKMSDEQSGSSSPKPASNPPRKKQSLKEIAERASQSGLSRPPGAPASMPGASSRPASATPLPAAPMSGRDTPLPSARPSATSTPLPSARPSAATSTPLPSARPSAALSSRPIEAGRDDSGIVDLNTMRATVTAQEKEAAEKAKPAAHGLMDDEPEAASAAPKAVRPHAAAAPAKKKGSGGAIAGIAVAVLGLAAAFAVVMVSNKNTDKQATVAVPESPKAAPTSEEPVAAKPATTAEATAAPEATGAPEAPTDPQPMAMHDPAKPLGGPMPTAAEAPPTAPEEAPKAATPTTPAPATTGGTPGNLNEAITKVMGGEKGAPNEEKAEPASGPGGKSKSSTVPEQPPQGSVQAAIGSVMGGAKACVAGADDVSRAQITFSSAGSVSNVSVSGWASGKGAAGCIKAALKGANVGPFSKPTYTVGVTIRP
jgi:hypothetical protein